MYYEFEVKADNKPFYHKYHSVEIDFSTEDDENMDLVTDDIFSGKEKSDNALIFV